MFLSPRFFCLSANEFFQTDVSHDSHFDRTMGVVMTVGMTGLLALTYVPPLGYLLRLCHAKPSPRCQRWDSLESSVVFAIAIALVTGTGTSNWQLPRLRAATRRCVLVHTSHSVYARHGCRPRPVLSTL